MAVLKDLIVHGASRFLNGINTNAIHANLIDAQDGVFKTITTTTLDAQTITTDMLKANNARVSQTLTVDGTISTNKWEAANIANIGGNFYISPTGKADSGNITVTKTSTTTINGVSVGVYTLVVSGTFGVTSTSSTIWGTSSKVIFTGSISYPQITGTDLTTTGKKYPLGTCNGTMTAVSTGTNTLTGFTITGVNSPALDVFFKEVGVSSVSNTACSGYEMQISVYQSYSSSALRPIGILLTSYGKEKKQYIDIYGGANALGSTTEEIDTGFTEPSVRIGQLDGLNPISYQLTNDTTVSSNKKYYTYNTSTYEYTKVTPASGANPKSLGYYEGIASTTPSGWGIYTTNGFFKGKVVASAGRIGEGTAAWTIGNDGNSRAYIYSGITNITSSGSTTGTYVGTNGISNYNSTTQYVNLTGGKITAQGADIAGKITATSGVIGGWSIGTDTNKSLHNGSVNTSPTIGSGKIILSKGLTSTTSIAGSSGSQTWMITAGTNFGVTTDGKLYASGAVLKTVSLLDDNGNERAAVGANGLVVKNSDGSIVGSFGSTVQVGTQTAGYVNIASTGMDIYAGSSNINLAHFGYDNAETADSESPSAISNSPFFTLGLRKTSVSAAQGDPNEVLLTLSNRYNIELDREMPAYPGSYSTVMGCNNVAIGPSSCAEGENTYAIFECAHSEGFGTAAIGSYSHAEGLGNYATVWCAHAEGNGNDASGYASHVEGGQNVASGTHSHAEGMFTYARGDYSHAGGFENTANGYAQTVIGRYNVVSPANAQTTFDSSTSPYVFIIGNGTSSSAVDHSNALVVDWGGNLRIGGNIYVGCDDDSSGGTRLSSAAVTGVKGSSESTYRTGQVSLSAANVGAVPTSRTVNSKALSSNISLTASDVGALATSGGTVTGNLTVNGVITAGARVSTTTPSSESTVNRITITPYYHTGGPWYINSADDSSNAYLRLLYNSTELIKIKHDGTFMSSLKTNITGNADTCSYPAGFASRTTGVAWGNTIGTSFTSWNDSTGGSIDFRQDNPSSGKVSIKVDGRFYYNEGSTAVWGLTSANGYWGMTDPDGNTSSSCWIRTTQAGIIPYQSGGRGGGHNYVGTDSWYFSQGYIDNVHGVTLDFNAATISGTTTIGGVTRINNSLYCDILYAGSGVVNADLAVGGTLRQVSDRKVKTHLKYLNTDNAAIKFVQQLRPAYYIKNNKPEVGFYAQDIQEVDPWNTMVESDEKGMLNLSYTEIIAPLVSYCHSLEKRIKELEAQK